MPNFVSTAIGMAKAAVIVMNRSMRTMNEREEFREMAADAMRREMTPEEETIWGLLRNHGWQAQAQVPMELPKYNKAVILDFYHPGLRVALEIDGPQHRKTRDSRRDRKLMASMGIPTLRFSNRQVRTKFEWVRETLWKLLD